MKKTQILTQILNSKIVAVIREKNIEQAVEVSNACLAGGIKAIEVTYTMENASTVIDILSKNEEMIVGAGSILDPETARLAILSGAKYIVSPSFNKEISKLCNRYQIPYMPGCITITEMVNAMEYGSDIIKMFPSNIFSPSIVKAVKGPIPQVNIMPTGGINLENIKEWFDNGVVAVGVGGDLTKGTYDEIVEKAKQFMSKIK
ncbi:MAG: bifunctional 2-keto-4-hydroxyglutarate aldolase/2-keto-3-deoxy-6-phosphogluconate aldolase [Fusobacteriaceae bacterium]|nr:bifunctional 2-keto-4-hydroxyglutarate aldolase/2-keto-3-deoxy-6-phosphogluconate aldolase [Fusobacteriaceae bacterium]